MPEQPPMSHESSSLIVSSINNDNETPFRVTVVEVIDVLIDKSLKEIKQQYADFAEQTLNTKFDRLNDKIDAHEKNQNTKFDRLNDKIDALEKNQNTKLEGLKDKIDGLKDDTDGVEKSLDTKFDGLKDDIAGVEKSLNTKFDTKIDELKKRITDKFDSQEKSISHITNILTGLVVTFIAGVLVLIVSSFLK
jgi:uncharacterized protein YdcH (DUF465 family)